MRRSIRFTAILIAATTMIGSAAMVAGAPAQAAPGTWVQTAELGTSALGGAFGSSVAASGSTGWAQAAELAGANTAHGDGFGDATTVSGSTVVVGAPNHALYGRAYVFSGSAGGPTTPAVASPTTTGQAGSGSGAQASPTPATSATSGTQGSPVPTSGAQLAGGNVTISRSTPANGATGVSLQPSISVTVSGQSTIMAPVFILVLVPAADANDRSARIPAGTQFSLVSTVTATGTPAQPLQPNTQYLLEVIFIPTGQVQASITFTTGAS